MSIDRVDASTPSIGFGGWTTTEVCFHEYSDIATDEDNIRNGVRSPIFSCFGHQWRLSLYPAGEEYASDGYASVRLSNRSDTGIKIQYGYSVRDANGKELIHHNPSTDKFVAVDDMDAMIENNESNAHSILDFSRISTMSEYLINGALVIEVRMRLDQPDTISAAQFVPANPITKNILKLFLDKETADVVFEVGLQQAGIKRAKSLRVNFHAHRLILMNNASALYDMCGVSDGGGITTVSITDVSPTFFKHMLYYSYGGKISTDILKGNAKDIINACDKYGLVQLKLEAEACYVESTEFTVDNMMDNLLYADSMNLAFLKEAVMDYIVRSKHSIIGKESLDKFPGHLVTELLTAMARREKGKLKLDSSYAVPILVSDEDHDVKRNRIRVGTLRKMLDEKGLSVDGSREEMIARLFKKEETIEIEGESVDRGERVLRRDGQWYDESA